MMIQNEKCAVTTASTEDFHSNLKPPQCKLMPFQISIHIWIFSKKVRDLDAKRGQTANLSREIWTHPEVHPSLLAAVFPRPNSSLVAEHFGYSKHCGLPGAEIKPNWKGVSCKCPLLIVPFFKVYWGCAVSCNLQSWLSLWWIVK